MAEAKKKDDKAPGKKPIRRTMTTTQRAEAIALWEAGEITLDGLAKKFGKSRQAFVSLFKREGVKRGSKSAEAAARVKDAVEAGMVDSAAEHAKKVKETKDETYRWAQMITRLTMKTIADAQSAGVAIGTKLNDLKALGNAANIIKVMREEKYAVLGLNEKEKDDDTPLPELVMRELTKEQIEQMQAEGEEDPEGDDMDAPFMNMVDAEDEGDL